jgi:3-methyladenine DNA glycosylase AlkD
MEYTEILEELQSLSHDDAAERAALVGIHPTTTVYGVRIPDLRRMAKEIEINHDLAGELWNTQIHDARILASMIADPEQVTEAQMESWAKDFDSWDICDQCCINLFRKTDFALYKAVEWSSREEAFIKRAAFALMAVLAVHDKAADDDQFLEFLPIIQLEAEDGRNFVKKAVSWALRQIGKRNPDLRSAAIHVAETLQQSSMKPARWIANDALRDLADND